VTWHSKLMLVPIMILLLVGTAIFAIYETDASSTDLVLNGGFEDGMKGWEFGPPPLALGGVDVVQTVSRSGSHSLRLIGPGVGFLQRLDHRSIFPEMQLSFYTLLNVTAGENEPQALFHLYFLLTTNGPTYYVDITVTHANSEDLAVVFEPNPGIDMGGIYLRFNREPLNSWIHTSVDISKLIQRYLPDLFDPHVDRIMLESAEGGKVYFDDISLNSTNLVHLQFIYLRLNYLVYSTLGKTVAQLLAYSVIVGACVSIYHRWRGRRTQT